MAFQNLTSKLPDGTSLTFRPIRPDDAIPLDRLIASLTRQDRRWRFHGAVNGVTPGHLHRMVTARPPAHLAVVAIAHLSDRDALIADARCAIDDNVGTVAEFALMVSPQWRRLGVGTLAMQVLRKAAADVGVHRLLGSVMADNAPMLALMDRCGFRCAPSRVDDGMVAAAAWIGADCDDEGPPRRLHAALAAQASPTAGLPA